MSLKSEHNKTNSIIQNSINSCRAPIASLECMEEGLLSSDSSMTTSPPSRQISLSTPATMRYKNLGKSGLKVSVIALGTWVNFGSQLSEEAAEEMVTAAYESGINFFDTGDIYAGGKAEILLGKILKKKEWKRSSYIVATKLFWGGKSETERGFSRKQILEGLEASLERLQLPYVDIVFVNKADPMCPMEEIVRACTHCINRGMALYWGTSRWSAVEIMESYTVARQFSLIPPSVEQTEYHLFQREKVEIYLPELFHKIGTGSITWSPQAFGILTGKFDEGVHLLSRGSVKNFTMLQDKHLGTEIDGRSPRHQSKLQELAFLAEKLGCTSTQLTVAWCLRNDGVHCVLVGASTTEQLYDHLQALQIVSKLTPNVTNEIEKILDNKPVRQPIQS